MINFAQKKKRVRWPSGIIGLFLGLNLAMFALVAISPIVNVNAYDPCHGDYPCYTKKGCSDSQGDWHACPEKCGSSNGGYCFSRPEPVNLSVPIGSLNQTIDLGQYIQAAYRFGVGLAGILAAVMIMIGGLQWLTAGSSERIGAAKKRILDATVGLVLTIGAWFILNTINPALVLLQMPRIPMVNRQVFVQCEIFNMQRPCGEQFSLKEKEGVAENARDIDRYEVVKEGEADSVANCVGGNCAELGFAVGQYSCQLISNVTANPSSSGDKASKSDSQGTATPPYTCAECGANGESCDGPGPDLNCCAGFCGGVDSGQICHNGANGRLCVEDDECRSGSCVSIPWSSEEKCLNGQVGSPCENNNDCESGNRCIEETGGYICAPLIPGGYCTGLEETCPGRRTVCHPELKRCIRMWGTQTGTLDDNFSSCSSGDQGNQQCQDNFGDEYRCENIADSWTCISGQPGTVCENNGHCVWTEGGVRQQGYCYVGGITLDGLGDDLGVCTAGLDGNGCDNHDDCVSGYCLDGTNICVGPNGEGGPCQHLQPVGSQGCAENLACHPLTNICYTSISN